MVIEIPGMTLGQVAGTVAAIAAIVSTVIEISPIKLNPWSWLAKRVGHAINGEVLAKVDQLEQRVNNLKATIEERGAIDARSKILRFGDECLHGDNHSKEHFDQILKDITEYELYCSRHPEFKNNLAVLTISSIKETYKQRMRKHDFL